MSNRVRRWNRAHRSGDRDVRIARADVAGALRCTAVHADVTSPARTSPQGDGVMWCAKLLGVSLAAVLTFAVRGSSPAQGQLKVAVGGGGPRRNLLSPGGRKRRPLAPPKPPPRNLSPHERG